MLLWRVVGWIVVLFVDCLCFGLLICGVGVGWVKLCFWFLGLLLVVGDFVVIDLNGNYCGVGYLLGWYDCFGDGMGVVFGVGMFCWGWKFIENVVVCWVEWIV